MLNLPSKDKLGNSYLSYSQISLFIKDEKEYISRYINKEPFISNPYIEFGSKVGEAIQNNDYCLFKKSEINVLNKLVKYDLFERKVIINFEGFYIIGFIDSCTNDCKKITDYKTGGLKKEFEYSKEEYNQLEYYAIAINQELGYYPEEATVQFVRRKGNLYRGECLSVADEEPILINRKIEEQKCNLLFEDTKKIALEIEKLYLSIK